MNKAPEKSDASLALRDRIQDDIKRCMKAQDKPRLAVLRLVWAAVKQAEIEAGSQVRQSGLTDEAIWSVLEKMLKQRQDSIATYQQANRPDLLDKERFEWEVIKTYLPPELDEGAVDALIAEAIAKVGATGPRDMGAVIAYLRPAVHGRADMGAVSRRVKAALALVES